MENLSAAHCLRHPLGYAPASFYLQEPQEYAGTESGVLF
jgi:hypothetical protein